MASSMASHIKDENIGIIQYDIPHMIRACVVETRFANRKERYDLGGLLPACLDEC